MGVGGVAGLGAGWLGVGVKVNVALGGGVLVVVAVAVFVIVLLGVGLTPPLMLIVPLELPCQPAMTKLLLMAIVPPD